MRPSKYYLLKDIWKLDFPGKEERDLISLFQIKKFLKYFLKLNRIEMLYYLSCYSCKFLKS